MKLDLLTSQVEDEYIRENFARIKRELEAQQILNGFWHFFEVDVTQVGVKVPVKHNLSFIPVDIIILSKEGDQSLYFNYADFDATNIYITTPKPCRVRFLAGSYKDRAYGGSKKDFAFVSPPSVSLPTWFTGVGSPSAGLGVVGDFYLDTSTKQIFLKAGTIFWVLQGYLMSAPESVIGQRLEISAISVLANTWTSIPLTNINKIADVTVFDDTTKEQVEVDWRLVSAGTAVEIRSTKAQTFTIYIEGYKI